MVLVLSLVILVIMTIAGLALVRSVDTGTLVAGNLAFQQAATQSGDAAAEDAIGAFLEKRNQDDLRNDDLGNAYSASVTNPSDWETYWATIDPPGSRSRPVGTRECKAEGGAPIGRCILPTDEVGNTVTYIIQRLCQTAGDPVLSPTGCASAAQRAALSGNSTASGSAQPPQATQYYYRVTARVDGPRNTQTYLQMIIAR